MWGKSDNGERGRKTAPADFAPRAPLANLWPDNKNLWLSPDISPARLHARAARWN